MTSKPINAEEELRSTVTLKSSESDTPIEYSESLNTTVSMTEEREPIELSISSTGWPISTTAVALRQEPENMETEEERIRREEEESIALARALMAEEAMAVSYAMSIDYLRHNRDQFSEEDLAALQAAMDDGDEEEAAASNAGDESGMSYELMLRLGERLGDVKSERWARVAREKIDALPTFLFDPKRVLHEDENDCEVKCLVCQSSYENNDDLRRLPCGHCFHLECVDQWLMSKNFCPYCRNAIADE